MSRNQKKSTNIVPETDLGVLLEKSQMPKSKSGVGVEKVGWPESGVGVD